MTKQAKTAGQHFGRKINLGKYVKNIRVLNVMSWIAKYYFNLAKKRTLQLVCKVPMRNRERPKLCDVVEIRLE